jgi:hypothetical protein
VHGQKHGTDFPRRAVIELTYFNGIQPRESLLHRKATHTISSPKIVRFIPHPLAAVALPAAGGSHG